MPVVLRSDANTKIDGETPALRILSGSRASRLSRSGLGKIDLEKEEGLVVRHEIEIRDIQMGVVDSAKVVVQIEKEEAVSGGVGRQDISAESHGMKRCGHLGPILAVARTGRSPGKRELAVSANIGIGSQERAIGDFFGGKEAQTLAILAGLRNDQLDGFRVNANRHFVVVPEINIDGDNACGVDRIFTENFFLVTLGAEIRIGDNGQVLMRVACGQRHWVGRRSLGQRANRQEHHDGKDCAEHNLVGYDAPSWK